MSEDTTRNLPKDSMSLILARFDSIDSRLDRIDSRLDGIDLRLDSLESRVTTLEDKVDKRLMETRPIWERALAEIAETRVEMREGFEKLHVEMNERFEKFHTEMHEEFGKVRIEMDDGLRRVETEINVLNRNLLEVRTDLQYFDRRITKLEAEPTR